MKDDSSKQVKKALEKLQKIESPGGHFWPESDIIAPLVDKIVHLRSDFLSGLFGMEMTIVMMG